MNSPILDKTAQMVPQHAATRTLSKASLWKSHI
jgi:hypothetical protein